MNTRRIFVGVAMSASGAKLIARKIAQYQELPIRWVDAQNWHLTLAFAGHFDDARLAELLRILEEKLAHVDAFDILFDQIVVAPDASRPKMIWLTTQQPQTELATLRTAVSSAITVSDDAHRPTRPHITLGRIKQARWRELGDDAPQIAQNVAVVLPVDTVSVFESTTEEGKRVYIPLATYQLG